MKLIKKTLFLAACAVTAWGVHTTTTYDKTASDNLLLSNVEALSAFMEDGYLVPDESDRDWWCTAYNDNVCKIYIVHNGVAGPTIDFGKYIFKSYL